MRLSRPFSLLLCIIRKNELKLIYFLKKFSPSLNAIKWFSMPCATLTPKYREWFLGNSNASSKSIAGRRALTEIRKKWCLFKNWRNPKKKYG